MCHPMQVEFHVPIANDSQRMSFRHWSGCLTDECLLLLLVAQREAVWVARSVCEMVRTRHEVARRMSVSAVITELKQTLILFGQNSMLQHQSSLHSIIWRQVIRVDWNASVVQLSSTFCPVGVVALACWQNSH